MAQQAAKQARHRVPDRELRLLNQIGPHLMGLPDREALLRSAVSFLRNDLSHKGARVALSDQNSEPQPSANGLFSVGAPAPFIVPIRLGNDVLGNIIIPSCKGATFGDAERETLQIFTAFLAVAIGSIRRLEEARSLASTDPLTGIMNRRKLFEIGPQKLNRARSTGLIVFDVDRFKAINDTFGHMAGDALLKAIAKRAQACIRKTDSLARYGGDEFVILLPNTEAKAVREIAERVRTYIDSTAVKWKGHSIRSTISVGLSCIDGDVDIHDLLSRADEALFAAKQAGRNLVR